MRDLGYKVGDRVRYNTKGYYEAGTIIDIRLRDDLRNAENVPQPLNLHYLVRWDDAHGLQEEDRLSKALWKELIPIVNNGDVFKELLLK